MFSFIKSDSRKEIDFVVNSLKKSFPHIFNTENKTASKEAFIIAKNIISGDLAALFNKKYSGYTYTSQYEDIIINAICRFGVSEDEARSYAVRSILKFSSSSAFQFPADELGGPILASNICTHTMIHGEHDTHAIMTLADLIFPQFRDGMGGIWSVTAKDADFLIRLIKADGEKYDYNGRVNLVDLRPRYFSDGIADRSGIKAKINIPDIIEDDCDYDFVSKTGEKEILYGDVSIKGSIVILLHPERNDDFISIPDYAFNSNYLLTYWLTGNPFIASREGRPRADRLADILGQRKPYQYTPYIIGNKISDGKLGSGASFSQQRAVGLGCFLFTANLSTSNEPESLSVIANHANNMIMLNGKDNIHTDKYFIEVYQEHGIDPESLKKHYLPHLPGYSEHSKAFIYNHRFGAFI